MFYASSGQRFYFGSEMKSLLAAEPALNTPDYRKIGPFFQFGYIRQPETIYRDIHRLPAGHIGVFERGRFEVKPYWTLEFSPDDSKSESDWLEQLDETLAESVKIRLESEVPLGVFLSGGLDSSAVVAYAHAAGLNPIKTFTIGFDRKEWDESEDAARVAKHFGTEHHLLQISEADLCESFEQTLQQIVFHCPPAAIFMGDAGSGFLGLMVAVLSLWCGQATPFLFWSWFILIGCFMVDATTTLVRRVRRGDKFHEAHRSHAYQHAARRFGKHRTVTLACAAINGLWLLPIACAVALGWIDGVLAVIVAYAPLVALAFRFDAGLPESPTP